MAMKLQIFMIKKFQVDSNGICLAVISLDSAPKKDENYYLQVFLKECKYTEKKVISHINGNVSIFLLLIILMILKLREYVLNFG